jgi:hypothetical protein
VESSLCPPAARRVYQLSTGNGSSDAAQGIQLLQGRAGGQTGNAPRCRGRVGVQPERFRRRAVGATRRKRTLRGSGQLRHGLATSTSGLLGAGWARPEAKAGAVT